MGLKVTITIDGAKKIDRGIWKAKLEPAEASTLGECESESGPFSVLLLESTVDYNPQSHSLTFDPELTRLLNIGSTDQIIVLSNLDAVLAHATVSQPAVETKFPESQPSQPTQPSQPSQPTHTEKDPEIKGPTYKLSRTLSTGDKLFLSELPLDIRNLGEGLLSEVRQHFPGELNYEPRSAKFDETPEIFWTVKIQPNDNSLRITVRGTLEDFNKIPGIDLKLDKFGYSAFVIQHPDQIPNALEVIKQARMNMT
jgi:hypothetical protein